MKRTLKIVFFGTDDFSTAVLDELANVGLEPALVVTAPDAPRGRGLTFASPSVKMCAEKHGFDIIQPKTLTGQDFLGELQNTDWDLFLVASYGVIIPKIVLDIPKHGTLNVHPSLLPKFRGASPVQSAILTDERETGVTIMLMDEQMDHGPIVAAASITPDPWPPKASILKALLAHEGGKLCAEIIPVWVEGVITPEPQDEMRATYTKKFTKADGLIDLAGGPYQNFLKIQALAGNPGVYFFTKRNGKDVRVKVVDAKYKDDTLIVTRVIPEGRREMAYEDFQKGER